MKNIKYNKNKIRMTFHFSKNMFYYGESDCSMHLSDFVFR